MNVAGEEKRDEERAEGGENGEFPGGPDEETRIGTELTAEEVTGAEDEEMNGGKEQRGSFWIRGLDGNGQWREDRLLRVSWREFLRERH